MSLNKGAEAEKSLGSFLSTFLGTFRIPGKTLQETRILRGQLGGTPLVELLFYGFFFNLFFLLQNSSK